MSFLDKIRTYYAKHKNQFSSDRFSGVEKTVFEDIQGFTLTEYYFDVVISSWNNIGKDVVIGNKIICIQEKKNKADPNAVLLMFAPQRKKLGYLYRGEMQDKVNAYLNRGDKVAARLSYLTFKPHKTVKIDIAFYQKNP